MVFACRESFLSFKSFPCRPLTSILCHIPRPCRSLRRRHLFFRKPNPVHAASFILSDFSANSPLHHPCKRRQYRRYRNRALRICEHAPPAKHIYPDGGLSLCSAQASLPDADPPCSFFCPQAVSKVCYSLCSRQHPFALLFYGFCFRFIFAGFAAFVHFRIGSLLFNRTELPDSTAFRTAKEFRVRSKASLLPALFQADAHFLRILLRAAAQPHR